MRTFRKKFNKEIKMHLACGNDNLHKELEYIYFKYGYAYASNGHVLIKNKISEIASLRDEEIELLNGKSIHSSSYKEMLKYDAITITENGIECEKGSTKITIPFEDTMCEKQIELMERVLKLRMEAKEDPVKNIWVDTDTIKVLNEAMAGGKRCKVSFNGEYKAMIFEPMSDNSSVGLVMPLVG